MSSEPPALFSVDPDEPLHLTVHIVRVTLLDVVPAVWRLIRAPSAVTLSVLHTILQEALGWEDRHLHEWRVGDLVFGSGEENWGEDMADETLVVLGEIAPVDTVLRYDYDLGDGWEHVVEVVAVDTYDGRVAPIAVLDGERSVPPEDCGGPQGYEHLIDALADPDDEEHDELKAWVGDGFDPRHFDRVRINRRLEELWRQ